jgi:hypothetical protein
MKCVSPLIKKKAINKQKNMTSLRKEWFQYVSKTRKKMSRGSKEPATHREAMKKASESWPKEKQKILRRIKREKKQECVKSRTVKKPKAPDSDTKDAPEK